MEGPGDPHPCSPSRAKPCSDGRWLRAPGTALGSRMVAQPLTGGVPAPVPSPGVGNQV